MSDETLDGRPAAHARGETRRAHFALVGGLCAVVVGFYFWSAKSGALELAGSGARDTYYNLLVQGFRAGQLNLPAEAPSGLAQLADPYDPVANAPYRLAEGGALGEMSYYHGKLYLYFGATPALLLFWPWHELTGHFLLHRQAVVIFFAVGFLLSAGLFGALWRRYFPQVGIGPVAAGMLVLGLANFTPAILQRCDVYEVAISCGYALTMVTLLLLWRSMHAARGRAGWLAGASLACGLAVGARPSLVLGAVILLVPVVRVCASDRALIGVIRDPEEDLLRTDAWLEKAAHWVLAVMGATPETIRRILERELPPA